MQTAERVQSVDWLLPDAGPKTLAALRIAAGVAVLVFVVAVHDYQLPPAGLQFPPTLGWLPASQTLFQVSLWVAVGAALALIVGVKPAAWVAAAAVFYCGWALTVTGKVDHLHHVVWVLIVVAVSPSANTWSVRPEAKTGSYRWPVFAVMLMIGLIYFGAGLQKFLSAGLEWGWSENMVNRMYVMAFESGRPVTQWPPVLGRLLGVGALIFELAFLPLLIHPATRRWVWPAGLAFHLGTWIVLGLSFPTLQLLYVVFLPWDSGGDDQPTRVQGAVLGALVAAVAVAALSGVVQSWPFAAYPGFKGIQTDTVNILTVDGVPLIDTPQASQVGRHRIQTVAGLSAVNDRKAMFAEWVDAEEISLVTVDVRTREVLSTRDWLTGVP